MIDLEDGLAAGGNDFLRKPFYPTELIARVKVHVQLKQSVDALIENDLLKKEIQERIELETRLRQSEKRFKMTLAQSSEGVVILDSTNKIVFVNEIICVFSQYTSEELLKG